MRQQGLRSSNGVVDYTRLSRMTREALARVGNTDYTDLYDCRDTRMYGLLEPLFVRDARGDAPIVLRGAPELPRPVEHIVQKLRHVKAACEFFGDYELVATDVTYAIRLIWIVLGRVIAHIPTAGVTYQRVVNVEDDDAGRARRPVVSERVTGYAAVPLSERIRLRFCVMDEETALTLKIGPEITAARPLTYDAVSTRTENPLAEAFWAKPRQRREGNVLNVASQFAAFQDDAFRDLVDSANEALTIEERREKLRALRDEARESEAWRVVCNHVLNLCNGVHADAARLIDHYCWIVQHCERSVRIVKLISLMQQVGKTLWTHVLIRVLGADIVRVVTGTLIERGFWGALSGALVLVLEEAMTGGNAAGLREALKGMTGGTHQLIDDKFVKAGRTTEYWNVEHHLNVLEPVDAGAMREMIVFPRGGEYVNPMYGKRVMDALSGRGALHVFVMLSLRNVEHYRPQEDTKTFARRQHLLSSATRVAAVRAILGLIGTMGVTFERLDEMIEEAIAADRRRMVREGGFDPLAHPSALGVYKGELKELLFESGGIIARRVVLDGAEQTVYMRPVARTYTVDDGPREDLVF